MKPIIKHIFIIVMAFSLFACQDDWLDPKPLSLFLAENVYTTKEGMESALLTLRRGLCVEYYGSPGPSQLTYEICTAETGAQGTKAAVGTHNFFTQVTPTGTGQLDFKRYWDLAYEQIKNANVIISRIDQPVWGSEEDKNQILAEAYFHRAYWYYRLVHQYGDVPFLNKEYTEPKIDFYTHSRKTILGKIQSDMEFSVQWLPEVVDPGKVNRAAGNHLLTKIYLSNSDFDAAIQSATNVINDGYHALMTERFGKYAGDDFYNVIWDLHQKENYSLSTNTEGILIAQNRFEFSSEVGLPPTGMMRIYGPIWWHTIYLKDPDGLRAGVDTRGDWQVLLLGRGVGYVRPSNYVSYDIWHKCGEDLRHDTTINWMPMEKVKINNPASNYYGQPMTKEFTNPIDTFQSWWPWPYYKVYVEDEVNTDQPRGGYSDLYIFRLAETYLLRAEAYYWKGQYALAAEDINKVRERANAPLISSEEVTLEYILDERARELYTEEPRKSELTRMALIKADNNIDGYSIENFHDDNYWFDRITETNNIYNTGIVWGLNEYKIGSFHVFWPIPQEIIDDNQGGVINQNPGYPGSENNIPPKTSIEETD